MTYQCSECSKWQETRYPAEKKYHNGRLVVHHYCDYSRKFEASDQVTSDTLCGGFDYVGRAVLTKMCEILGADSTKLFASFDEAKENYIMPCNPELMAAYNSVAAYICEGLDKHPDKETIAKTMFNSYIIDAEANVRMGNYCKATAIYSEMVRVLHIIFDVINDYSIYQPYTKTK